jgi:hypothetical protein
MSIDELETEALKLDPKSRARLAGKLLASFDDLSEDGNAALWAEEAARRNAAWDAAAGDGQDSDAVFGEARARLE